MITKNSAATSFLHVSEKNSDGTPKRYKRTGKTQIWKTRPEDFKIPVKRGLWETGYITQHNAHMFVEAFANT
jgi:hypothetical protein